MFCIHQQLDEIIRRINQKDRIEIIQFIGDRWGIDKITLEVIKSWQDFVIVLTRF
jgi:hypothetical protein